MRRQLPRLFFALVTVFSSLGIAAPTAIAHAGLVSANPAANVEITAMPVSVELTFTEDLMTLGDKNVNTISMTDPSGNPVNLSELAVNGALLSANLPEATFESGSYTVTYSIVSADGHKLSGSYSFSLNAPTLYQEPTPEPSQLGVIPLPIALAIAVVIGIGGYLVLNKRRRQP
jgi:methionine-rich copper-binding protein CopC